jgi:hypothetical protein
LIALQIMDALGDVKDADTEAAFESDKEQKRVTKKWRRHRTGYYGVVGCARIVGVVVVAIQILSLANAGHTPKTVIRT